MKESSDAWWMFLIAAAIGYHFWDNGFKTFSGDAWTCGIYKLDANGKQTDQCARQRLVSTVTVAMSPTTGTCSVLDISRDGARMISSGTRLAYVSDDDWSCSIPIMATKTQRVITSVDGKMMVQVVDPDDMTTADQLDLVRSDTVIGHVKHWWAYADEYLRPFPALQ
ncbi:UNVERIFIED_ORG: hypothetical protein J2Y81_002102 [Paraburkholderia sediminicola]|nr:hypothetical protein [Paraburkholderia sediminicola]